MLGFLGEEQSSMLDTIFGAVGTAIGIGLNSSAVVLFYEIYKKRRVYTEVPETYLITNIICNIVNLAYGFQLKDSVMIISSGIGTCLAVLWGCLYLFYFSKKKMNMFLLYCFINFNLSCELLYIFAVICPTADYAGTVALGLTVINAGTPGQNIIKVIRTGNYNLIPIVTTTFGFLCGFCWFVFGLLKNRYLMYVPNGLGLILSLLQIIVFTIMYNKHKGESFAQEEEQSSALTDDKNSVGKGLINDNEDNNIIHDD